MFCEKWFSRLTLAVILALLSCVQPVSAATTFSDIKGHWAEQSILEMNAYGIIHGYPGGLFKPGEGVQFQQAIVMIINTIGLGEKAAKTDLTGLTFPSGTWAKGYLALAVQKGMLTREDLTNLKPKRIATRSEVASLLCLALGFEPDLRTLTFLDANKVSEKSRGYIGAIVKRGIMRGLPGNIFAPEMEVTRAQMCTMLLRLIDEDWVAPPPPMKRLSGRITEVDEEKGTVTIRNLKGQETVTLLSNCPLVDGNKTISLSSLDKNKRIKLITDNKNSAHYARLLDGYGSADRTEEGFVVSFTSGPKGYFLTLETDIKEKLRFELYDDTRIHKGNSELNAADLKEDFFVEVHLDKNNRIFEIEVFEPKKVSGILTRLSNTELTIKRKGKERDYQVSKNVRVTRNMIRNMEYVDLKRGDYISLVLLNDKVFQIDCLSDVVTGLGGMVSRVHDKTIYIYVQNEKRRYDLDESVEVIRNGRLVDIEELKRGNYITFEVSDDQKVISIEILDEEEGKFTGTVKYLGIANKPFITMLTIEGLELDYEIDQGVSVFRHGDEINLEDIVPGAKVQIKVEEGKVVDIEVLDDLNITVKGQVTNINKEQNRLTLEINGRKYNYNSSSNLVITGVSGKTIRLSELVYHYVEAKIEEGEIKEVKIID